MLTNLQRLLRILNREPVDRLLAWDYMDNEAILVRYGSYDRSKQYSFEESAEVDARAFRNIGFDMTRGIYDPVNHWMGTNIRNWIRFFGVDPGTDQPPHRPGHTTRRTGRSAPPLCPRNSGLCTVHNYRKGK